MCCIYLGAIFCMHEQKAHAYLIIQQMKYLILPRSKSLRSTGTLSTFYAISVGVLYFSISVEDEFNGSC
jgi:hypothetical protein